MKHPLFVLTGRHATALATLLLLSSAQAAVRLPAILSDHMVLQRAARVPVWGWSAPNEEVTVSIGDQRKAVRADETGRWLLDLDTRQLSASATTLVVRGHENAVSVQDVLIGEVWLASGQSNMEKPVGDLLSKKRTRDVEKEIAAADAPLLRLFKVPRKKAATPADDTGGVWVVSSAASLAATKFSAAAYFFGQRLHGELKSPVGMIDSSWGGTRIEVWMPANEAAASLAQPGNLPDAASSQMFNGMIAPLAPFAIKGVIWYQGESNVTSGDDGPRYLPKMEALIRSWRNLWGAELPFYYTQIAPHLYSVVRAATVKDPESAPRLREAQADALRIPGTGMIVTTDLADNPRDIHPRDKKPVGERLANLALNGSYHRADVPTYGPVYHAMAIEGSMAVLSFDYADGLASRDGKPLTFFDIAGADGHFVAATATIQGQRILVSSPQIAAPVAVRFGWHEAAQPNLVNGAGLPAMPFRSAHPIAFYRRGQNTPN